jgi:DNA-binding transcriptional MerR regulator
MLELTEKQSMDTKNQVVSRNELAKRLNIVYNTVVLYEKYGWLPKAERIKGTKEVFYTEEDYFNLVNTLKKYGKIK